jgi:hypothetical protein
MNPVLNKEVHAGLLADLDGISETAGVQPRFLRSSMTEYCGAAETDWVTHFKQYRADGVPGLMLDGVQKPDTRCQAITAALLRNFIDARVMPLNQVLELQKTGDMPLPSVLVIPNLYILLPGKGLPPWQVQAIYDVLLHRAVRSAPTVVYVQDKDEMAKVYGIPFADFLSGFRQVQEGM